jgi:hypothetical protein
MWMQFDSKLETWAGVLPLAMGIAACGGTTAGGKAGDRAASTDGGSESDGPTDGGQRPPPAQGGFEMSYRGGGFCPHAATDPQIIPAGFYAFNPGTEPRLTTGVTCTVQQNGDAFLLDLEVQTDRNRFEVSGTVMADVDQPVQLANRAPRGVNDPGFLDTVVDSACPLNVIYIAAGTLHATFDCDNLNYPPGMIECAASGGFVFENCEH